MKLVDAPFFRKYLLPGFVFQSVVIAGGYGTGREIVEYFLRFGTLGGLLGMTVVATLTWSVTLALTFEFSRVFAAFDYRTFFQRLLGRGWVVFEVLYLYGALLALAVLGSAAGVLLRDNFGVPYMVGVLIMYGTIGYLTFKGSDLIGKTLASWSLVLYAVYLVILIVSLDRFGPVIRNNFTSGEVLSGWFMGGFKYAMYNFIVIPALLFCLRATNTRKEALVSGLSAGVIGIVPGILFYVAIVSQYPSVLAEEVPIVFLLEKTGVTPLLITFQIVLFGTLIETGTGLIHAVNERIAAARKSTGATYKRRLRPAVAAGLLLAGYALSSLGLVALVAKGYGTLGWGVLVVFAVPLFTRGWLLINRQRD
jgi:uncharacterized membrane protein YkvI